MPPLSESMIRKQIHLEPRQAEMLKRLARERGVTQSQIVREALDRMEMEMESQRIRDLEARRGWSRDSLSMKSVSADGLSRDQCVASSVSDPPTARMPCAQWDAEQSSYLPGATLGISPAPSTILAPCARAQVKRSEDGIWMSL